MPILPEQLIISDFSLRLIILLVVIVIERYFSINDAYHPATLFRYIAQRLALKVNKRGATQQAISGIISGLILMSLVMGVVVVILSVAIYPWFFDALFLLVALRFSSLLTSCNKVKTSLLKQRKSLAREQLGELCIRDTATLSTMGIVKAAIESVIQRPSLSYFNIIIYYALFGIYIALTVALINALASYWNPKKQAFRHFGRLFSDLVRTINLPIQYLMAINVALLFGLRHLSLKPNGWHNPAMGALLTTTANTLKRQLGGAVIYDSVKIRRAKLGPNNLPDIEDLKHIVSILTKLQLSIATVLTFTLVTSLTLTNL